MPKFRLTIEWWNIHDALPNKVFGAQEGDSIVIIEAVREGHTFPHREGSIILRYLCGTGRGHTFKAFGSPYR